MKKLKKTETSLPDPVSRVIRGYGWSQEELGAMLHTSDSTASRRLVSPDDFTVGDLRTLVRNGVKPEELASAVFKVPMGRLEAVKR